MEGEESRMGLKEKVNHGAISKVSLHGPLELLLRGGSKFRQSV